MMSGPDLENYSSSYSVNKPSGRPVTGQKRTLELEIFESEQSTLEAAATFVSDQVNNRQESVLLLPTGRTPLTLYTQLVSRSQADQLDLSRVTTFNLDEFYGIGADHPGSYHSYMRRCFFNQVPVAPQNINMLDGTTPDPVAECRSYDQKIEAAGGIDLAVLGIGANGHIGFNEPGSTQDSRTRLVVLQPETRASNAFLFDNQPAAVPPKALTVGIATILQAKRVLLLATGEIKAQAVYDMLNGPVTAGLPASFLRLHPSVSIMIDRNAAERINVMQRTI